MMPPASEVGMHFRLCVFALNAAHVKRAGIFIVYIGHADEDKLILHK